MSTPIRWTKDKIVTAYRAEAMRLGHRPKTTEIASDLRAAIYAGHFKIGEVALLAGVAPDPNARYESELCGCEPPHVWPPEAPNPRALSADQLARELRASLRRQGRRTDWRANGFRMLGIGPRREIRYPDPDAQLLFVPPEDLAYPKRRAA